MGTETASRDCSVIIIHRVQSVIIYTGCLQNSAYVHGVECCVILCCDELRSQLQWCFLSLACTLLRHKTHRTAQVCVCVCAGVDQRYGGLEGLVGVMRTVKRCEDMREEVCNSLSVTTHGEV